MRVSITGTPGVGKHSIARRVAAKMHIDVVDLSTVARKEGLILEGEPDIEGLKKLLEGRKNCIFVSHYAELVPADLVIVVRCEPKELVRRLGGRGYSIQKIMENVECECLDFSLVKANENCERVGEVDNSGDLEESVEKAVGMINGTIELEYGKVDYSECVDKIGEIIKAEL